MAEEVQFQKSENTKQFATETGRHVQMNLYLKDIFRPRDSNCKRQVYINEIGNRTCFLSRWKNRGGWPKIEPRRGRARAILSGVTLSEPTRNPDNTADKAVSARYDRHLDASGTSSSLDSKGKGKIRRSTR